MLWVLSLHTHQVVIVRFWVPSNIAVYFPQIWKYVCATCTQALLLVAQSLAMVISACELAACSPLGWKTEGCRAFFFYTQMPISFQ